MLTLKMPEGPLSADESAICRLYEQMLTGWNSRNAAEMAAPFAEDGLIIGFDGSQQTGRADIATSLQAIFAEHKTPPYLSKITSVRLLGAEVGLLRAIVGMALPGQTSIEPSLNSHQTLVARRYNSIWQIVLLQNTPAQFHGRPDLVQQMTEELQEIAN